MKPLLSDSQFMLEFERHGAARLAAQLGVGLRNTYARRRKLERETGQRLSSPNAAGTPARDVDIPEHPGRLLSTIADGICLVGSDCHYWPGPPSLMHRAFVSFCKGQHIDKKPVEVIINGDVIDAGQISRYPPIGWTQQPTLKQEIEAAQERLGEIEAAAGRVRRRWPLGNHDARFETRLATQVREFAQVQGTSLVHHFPLWEPCWSVWINDEIVVKHRYKGGIHATRNNTLMSGKSIITGHLHSAKVSPFDDYNGTRYGVDTGCIADPKHRAFVDYTEDNPKDWRAAFAVLTFVGSRMLPPELVLAWDATHVTFRGKIIHV
jgi:hypothetical protein